MRHKIKSPSDLITLRESLIKQRDPRAGERSVRICTGGGCIALGALDLRDSLKELLEKEGIDIPVKETGCMGPCAHGPVLNIQPDDIYYRGVTAADLPLIATEHLRNGRVVDSLLMDRGINSIEEKIVLRNCGRIDPLDIEDSIREGGYGALAGILEEGRDPESVIGELKKSGLRGRGGAGFPTWMKWDFTARADGEEKYVLCNGDEGDPGAFMDRSVLEGDPHSLIEGMLIAAVAIGAERGFIYVRA
ncbi:MAG: NAD(P)H-dependent oxidoreductase subunit E, partial [Spirochaetales bacterium]|nr:NAD(P)H-dependent oxidoreductase subunit E [Spirochaetales bacterium]